MKILMYAPIFPPMIGGPATQCHQLCGSLKKHGEEVVVVTVGDRFSKKIEDGILVYRYPWRYTNTFLDKVLRWLVFPFYFFNILRKEKPEIVHAHSVSVLSFVAGLVCKIMGIPTVIKFAGDWVWETLSTSGVKAVDFDDLYKKSALARFMWKFEKWGLTVYDFIWAPSEFRAQNVERVLGHRKNTTIIYNALDLPEGGYHEAKEGDDFVIVSSNRFIPHKRLDWLVKIFAELNLPNSKLVLTGTGEEVEVNKVKNAIIEYNVSDKVFLGGRLEQSEVYNQFKKSSIYVSSSLEEGFPNVFVEAMHFGLPIVSTDVGGCKEIVREGETGYLFEIHDEKLLKERIKTLYNDVNLRNHMASSSYDYSRQYELNTVVNQFLDLYKKALSKK